MKQKYLVFILNGIFISTYAYADASDKVMWDAWYTIKTDRGSPVGYYNDHVELKGDRVYFQNKIVRKEGDYLNEESLGAYSKNDEAVTPVMFNFRKVFIKSEAVVDATIENGKTVKATITNPKGTQQAQKEVLPKGSILSTMFPVWLGKKLPQMASKKKTTATFIALLEDATEGKFETVSGNIIVTKADEFSKSSHTIKVLTTFGGRKSTWYVEATGMPVKIEFNQDHLVALKCTQGDARASVGDIR